MKTLMTLALLAFSTMALAQGKCDLSENDQAVAAVNKRMDEAQMRGEDHLIALTELKRERLDLMLLCVQSELTEGLDKAELSELKAEIESESSIVIGELNRSIKEAIESNRISMATKLMMERDIEKLNAQNQIDRINKILNA